MIIAYTDGACSKNGSKDATGGFGVVVMNAEPGNHENGIPFDFHSKLCNETTTNNREELKAILYVMIKYGKTENDFDLIPEVFSDSAYSINTLSNWMFGWAKNGWIKGDKKTPENLDLIKPYYDLYQKGYRINLHKVKGHSGIKWNEVVDNLATGQLTENEAWRKFSPNSVAVNSEFDKI